MYDNKKTIIIIAASVATVLLIGVGYLFWKGAPSPTSGVNPNVKKINENMGPEAAKETQKLIEDVKKNVDEAADKKEEPLSQIVSVKKTEQVGTTTVVVEEKAVIVAPGSSPISLETGNVLGVDGEKTSNQGARGGVSAPQFSGNVDPVKLPESAVKLSVNMFNFSPAEFTVKPKQAVSLSITNEGPRYEIIVFKDPSLSAIAMSIYPQNTAVITFNAPENPGEYVFYSDFPSRPAEAFGKMIVK